MLTALVLLGVMLVGAGAAVFAWWRPGLREADESFRRWLKETS